MSNPDRLSILDRLIHAPELGHADREAFSGLAAKLRLGIDLTEGQVEKINQAMEALDAPAASPIPRPVAQPPARLPVPSPPRPTVAPAQRTQLGGLSDDDLLTLALASPNLSPSERSAFESMLQQASLTVRQRNWLVAAAGRTGGAVGRVPRPSAWDPEPVTKSQKRRWK